MWYLLDGKMQPPGKLAVIASNKLQGLNKPVYHQLSKYCLRSVMGSRALQLQNRNFMRFHGTVFKGSFLRVYKDSLFYSFWKTSSGAKLNLMVCVCFKQSHLILLLNKNPPVTLLALQCCPDFHCKLSFPSSTSLFSWRHAFEWRGFNRCCLFSKIFPLGR